MVGSPTIESSMTVLQIFLKLVAAGQPSTKINISPDDLEEINAFLPRCEATPSDFNDDQDAEIANAFQEGKQSHSK